MITDRSLKIYYPVIYNFDPNPMAMNLNNVAVNWRRSTRRDGGYFMGSFIIPDDVGVDLPTFYYSYLGYHFVEKSAGVTTWEGMVYEMDLTNNGITRRVSLDSMYNHATAIYTDENGDQGTATAVQGTVSITRYGRKEEYLYLDGYPSGAVTSYQEAFLEDKNWPNTQLVGRSRLSDKNQLKVTVAGYIFTANWRFESAGDASTDDVSNWITEIVNTDCPLLSIGAIDSNTLQVKKDTPLPRRALDTIFELSDLGDNTKQPWRFYVDNGRMAYYNKILNTPQYYISQGKILSASGHDVAVDPWAVTPGVYRDLDYPINRPTVDSWLADERDFYVDEVEYGDGMEQPIFKSVEFEESEYLAAQHEFANRAFPEEEE